MINRAANKSQSFLISQDLSDSMLKEKDEQINAELKKAQYQIEETTTRVNTLAKQNGTLRAQNEQQKIQFSAKEQELRRQISKAKKDFAQETNASDRLKQKNAILERSMKEKDQKLSNLSRDLVEKISYAERVSQEVEAKDMALSKVHAELNQVKATSEKAESINKANVVELQKNIAEMSDEILRMSTESSKLQQDKVRVTSLLEDSKTEVRTLQLKLKDVKVRHESSLDQIIMEHRKQFEEKDRFVEELQKQLSDSKQIIESTITELHNTRKTAVEREVKRREESEKQLLAKISDITAENKSLRQQLGDSGTKASIVESNLDQIQQSLFEATEKASTLSSDLQEAQKCNNELQSQCDSLSRELNDRQIKIQELTGANERLEANYNTVVTESQGLRFQLSELQRSSDNKVAHLSQLIDQQAAEFDHKRIQFEEEMTDSKVMIQNLMTQLETVSNESSDAHKQKLAKVVNELAMMESIVTKLKDEKEQIQELLDACEIERSSLVGDNKILAERMASAEASSQRWMETSRLASLDVSNLKEVERNARSRGDRLQEMVDQTVIERDAFASELKIVSGKALSEKNRLEAELVRVKDELSSAQHALNERSPDEGALMRQIVQLEDNLRKSTADLEHEKSKFTKKISEQSGHHKEMLSEVRASFVESVQEKESFIEKLQKEIEDKQSQIQRLSQEKDVLSSKLEDKEELQATRNTEIAALKNEVEALKSELHICEANAESTKNRCEEMAKEMQEHSKRADVEIDQQRKRSEDLLSECRSHSQNRIDEMQRLFSLSVLEKEEFIEKLQEDLESKQDSIDTLVQDHRLVVEEKDDLLLKLCEMQSRLKLIQNELEKSKREIVKQQEALRQTECNSNSRTEQLHHMFKTSVAEKESFIDKLQLEIEEKQDNIDQLAQNHKAEIEKLHNELAGHKLSYDAIQLELAEAKKELNKQRLEVQKILSESDTKFKVETEKLQLIHSSYAQEKENSISTLKEHIKSLEATIIMLQDKEEDLKVLHKNLSIELLNNRKEHEVTVETYKIKLDNVSKEFNEKLQVIEDLNDVQKKLEEAKETLEEKQNMIDELRKEKQDVFTKSESLSNQLEEVQLSLATTAKDANGYLESLYARDRELEAASSTIVSLQDRIRSENESMTLQINVLNDKIFVAEVNLREAEEKHLKQVENMCNEFEVLKSDHARHIADLEASHSAEMQKLNEGLEGANLASTSQKKKLVALEEAIAARDQSIEKYKDELNFKEEAYYAFKEQNEHEISRLQGFTSSLRKTIDEESLIREGMNNKVKLLESALKEANDFNTELKKKANQCKDDLAAKDKCLGVLTSNIINTCRDLNLNLNGYASTLNDYENSPADLVNILREAVKDHQSNAMAGFELANSRERAASRLERTLNAKERDIKVLQESATKLRSSLDEIKNQQFLTKSLNSDLQLKIDLVEKDKAEIEKKYILSEEVTSNLRREKMELESKIMSLASELSILKESLLQAQTTINENEVKLMILDNAREQVNTQSKLIQQLQSDLDDVSAEMEFLITQNESMERFVMNAEEIIQSTEANEESLRGECVDLKMKLSDSVAEVSRLQTNNNLLYDENTSLIEELSSCSNKIDELEEALSSKNNEMNREKAAYESNAQAQKKIATVLEKHLRARSDEILRQRKAKDAEIAGILQKLEGRNGAVQLLSTKVEEAESKLRMVLMQKEELDTSNLGLRGQLLEKEEEVLRLCEQIKTLESDANDMRTSLDNKDTKISQIADHMEDLLRKESEYQIEHCDLLEQVESKSSEIDALKSQVRSLNGALTTSHKKLESSLKELEHEKIKFEEKCDEYQDAKARLFGAEKLSTIHDKECTRLLNDIESKSQQIASMTEFVQTMENEREEESSKINELEASLSTQKEIIGALEAELRDRSNEIEDFGSHNARLASDVEKLNEKIASLEEKLEHKQSEMEVIVRQSKDDAINMSDLQQRLEASEEEVQLLCEGIEDKDKEIPYLHETISRLREEKTEAISLLGELQEKFKTEARPRNATHSIDCFQEDGDISLGISRPSLSPTASDIVQKHSALLDDLVKMKSTIYDAISPSKSSRSDTTSDCEESSGPLFAMLQDELQEKNGILQLMGDQVDSLMKDITEAKKSLHEKDAEVEKLTSSLKELEESKSELKRRLKGRKSYIKQLEDALSHEVKHRRETEVMLNSAMEEKRALATEYRTKSDELSVAQKTVEEKSSAVEEQMKVARQLAKQLHTTKQKIFALKQHLQNEGLLKDGNLSSLPYHSPLLQKQSKEEMSLPDINNVTSNDSINWNVSEDDYST